MKTITDEQYAAINELIQSLQFLVKDFSKNLLNMKHHYLFKDDQVSIDLMEKSLNGEDWAKPAIKWKPVCDPDMFVTKREVRLEKIIKKMALYITDKYGYDADWSIKELKEIAKICEADNEN